jgi:hypothetical protein
VVSLERPRSGRQDGSSLPRKMSKKLDRKAGKTGTMPYYIAHAKIGGSDA